MTNNETITGLTINIDGRALSHDLLPIGGEGPAVFLPRATINQITLNPGSGYGFQPGSGIVADLRYGVGADGRILLDPEYAEFASASGNTLMIRGQTINIDGRALSHDLLPIGIAGDTGFLARREIHQLTLIPASGYSFQPGSGIVADLTYSVGPGGVDYPASCDRFMGGRGTTTLIIRGYPLVLSAADADSDLVGITNLGLLAQTPRELAAVLIPAQGYCPQTSNGVCTTPFNVERDGRITFAAAAAGSYLARNSSVPNPSRVGEEVTILIDVRPAEPAFPIPQGGLTFSVADLLLGTATLDRDGRTTFRTSALTRGDHEITIAYAGSSGFLPSSTTVHHRVE